MSTQNTENIHVIENEAKIDIKNNQDKMNKLDKDFIIKSLLQDSNRDYITELKNGLSNQVFLVKVLEKNTRLDLCKEIENSSNENKDYFKNPKSFKFILRIYGSVASILNREGEIKILRNLEKHNLCAKLIKTEDDYRVEEYLEGYKESSLKDLIENENEINEIISNYNLIEVVNYKRNGDDENPTNTIMISKQKNDLFRIKENNNQEIAVDDYSPIFELLDYNDFTGHFLYNNITDCIIKLNNVIKSYNKLSLLIADSNETHNNNKVLLLHIDTRMNNINLLLKKITKIKNTVNSILLQKSILVLSHNDLHRLNLMIKSNNNSEYNNKEDSKLNGSKEFRLLDFEFSKLNFLGIDYANFLIEKEFDYDSNPYSFKGFNIEKNFPKFIHYIDLFLDKLKAKNEIVYKKLFIDKDYLKSKEYFNLCLKMSCMFWILGLMYIPEISDFNINNWINKLNGNLELFSNRNLFKEEFDYIDYVLDRMKIFDSCMVS